ncbi:sensor histidine kinase [uncultured Ruminococcus sp.]|uniref:sensor histidine kinase n=1 Tax=uncultured Ruminococcus sp. TaxID=165186 RepID=UPI0025DF190E|nr:histidine kinase [uncultured Ruminococcus sp.]
MVAEYINENYMTFMILFSLIAAMIVNKDVEIPASRLFITGITLLTLITLNDLLHLYQQELFSKPNMQEKALTIRTWGDSIAFILRPVLIMIEIFMVMPEKKLRKLCAVPAVLNGLVFSTAIFGSKIAFSINPDNSFNGGPLHFTIYMTQIVYIIMLLVLSVINFKQSNRGKSLMLITMFMQAVFVAVREYKDIAPSFTNAVTALCMLDYYIYLATIERQAISDSLLQKELDLTKSELTVLRNQIQPHFIYNVLSMIRSLTRTDTEKAVQAINNFSKYLKTHIKAIQNEDMIPFEEELKNVRVYVDLAQTDYPGEIELVCDFEDTDFTIPALSLEPIVENAIQHGISRMGGRITMTARREDGMMCISISDNGTAKKDITPKFTERLGVGLENTRRRLAMQCGGRMETLINENGCTVTIRIPETRRENNEDTGGRRSSADS